MKNKTLILIFSVTIMSGLVYYFKIESSEEYLQRLKTIDTESQIRYRIEPMPNVFVAKKYRLGDWGVLESKDTD
jgi:hypothetical protein